MRLLLDECLDWRLLRDLPEHEFDAFVTADKNLTFQQNVTRFRIAVIVLRSSSLRLRDLRKVVPNLRAALEELAPGEVDASLNRGGPKSAATAS